MHERTIRVDSGVNDWQRVDGDGALWALDRSGDVQRELEALSALPRVQGRLDALGMLVR